MVTRVTSRQQETVRLLCVCVCAGVYAHVCGCVCGCDESDSRDLPHSTTNMPSLMYLSIYHAYLYIAQISAK